MRLFDETESTIMRSLRPFRIQAANAVRRAVVKLVDDSPMLQTLQLLVTGSLSGVEDEDEVQPDVEHFEHYGVTTHPPAGSEAILVRMGGDRDVQAVVATSYREARPHLDAEGDVTIWDKDGQMIELKRAKIVITLFPGNTLELGAGATKGVARVGDPVIVDDAAFVAWMSAVDAAILGLGGPPLTNPGQATGDITAASAVVKAVD